MDELKTRREPNAENGIKVTEFKLPEVGHSTNPSLFKVKHNLQHLQNNPLRYFEMVSRSETVVKDFISKKRPKQQKKDFRSIKTVGGR